MAGHDATAPRSTEMKAGEQQPLQLCLEAVVTSVPGPAPSILPGAGGPASTETQTSVMSYMQTPSSATQAKGRAVTQTAPGGSPGLAPPALGNACGQAACLQPLPEHPPWGICLGFCAPDPLSPRWPGGGGGWGGADKPIHRASW